MCCMTLFFLLLWFSSCNVGTAGVISFQAAGFCIFMQFFFCGIIQILLNLDLDRNILVATNLWIFHGDDTFSSETDPGTGLHTLPDLADYVSIQGRNCGFSTEYSSCIRDGNSCVNIGTLPFIARA